jgi:hypothetical protein
MDPKRGGGVMSASTWTDADSERARQIWAEYQREHDVTALVGRTAGIDPVSRCVWFGESAADIWRQRQAEGVDTPIYCVRVGFDYYLRKGSHR